MPEVKEDDSTYKDKNDNDLIPNDISEEDDVDELYRKVQKVINPNLLHVVSMTELYGTAYKSKPPIIDGLLYPGVYILAGAPKIGKSFLVAQIAFHVSTGRKLWDFDVHQGTVLYLALEDDFQRLQNRMFKMFGFNDTEKLYFAIAAGKLGASLDEQMKNFISKHKDTNLIVIDTLQKICEASSEGYSYSNDYKIIGSLKEFAVQNNICILVVHHTRKQPSDDIFEMISGTTGLLGSADGALLMHKEKRTSLEATVAVVGRDQQDQVLYLTRDPDTQIWALQKTETELYKQPKDHILEAVAKLVSSEQTIWEGSPSQLAELIPAGMAPNVLTKYLNIHCGRLLDEYHVSYENRAKHAGRKVKLTYLPSDTTEE